MPPRFTCCLIHTIVQCTLATFVTTKSTYGGFVIWFDTPTLGLSHAPYALLVCATHIPNDDVKIWTQADSLWISLPCCYLHLTSHLIVSAEISNFCEIESCPFHAGVTPHTVIIWGAAWLVLEAYFLDTFPIFRWKKSHFLSAFVNQNLNLLA